MHEEKIMTNEEIKKIMEALQEAYTKAGRKVETAVQIENVDEDGNITGEVLIDNRDKKEIN